MKLTLRGQQQEITASYHPEELPLEVLKAKAEAFISALNVDNLFVNIAKEIIDDAYSQSDTKADPAEYLQLIRDLKLERLEFGDEEVMMFLDAQGVGVTCQLAYEPVGEIENLELDL